MDRKSSNGGGGNNKITFEDFEPSFCWKKEADKDTIELQVEGFKIVDLQVQASDLGPIIVKGERSLDDKKLRYRRFREEFKLKNEHIPNGIRAKLGNGILSIIIPKVNDDTTSHHQQPSPENSQDTLPDKKPSKPTEETKYEPKPDRNPYMVLTGRPFGDVDRRALWFTAMVVGAAAVGITAYLSYKYWFLAGKHI